MKTLGWSAGSLQVPGDCSFVLEAVTSGRLSLLAAGVETTAEVTMTICILKVTRVTPTAGDASVGCFLTTAALLCFVCVSLTLSHLISDLSAAPKQPKTP